MKITRLFLKNVRCFDKLTITFDPRFIAEFLRVLEPEKQVRLELIDSESAAVFRTDEAYTYVIMPLSREGN